MKAPTSISTSKRIGSIKAQLNDLAGKMCDKQVLSAFCNLLIGAATKKELTQLQLASLERSTNHLLGQQLTPELIDANTWRVLANWHFIMEGMEVPIWTGEKTDTEALFLGIAKQRVVNNNKLFLDCTVKLRSGLPAGIISRVRLTPRQISFFLNKHSGAKSCNCAVEEISGMKAMLVVEMRGDDIAVVDWKCNDAQRQYNRQLAEARRDPRKCSTFQPCNTCPKTTRECNLAIWLPEG